MIAPARMTVEEFERIAYLPENAEKRLEFIGGEIFEMPSNAYVSKIAMKIAGEIYIFLKANGIEGHLTGEGGGYQIAGERYAPDIGFVSKARQAELAKAGYNPVAPDLAVEVETYSDAAAQARLRIKITNYLAAGTVVWVVFADAERVEIHAPGQPVIILYADDTLSGGDVLPGFALPLREIFPKSS